MQALNENSKLGRALKLLRQRALRQFVKDDTDEVSPCTKCREQHKLDSMLCLKVQMLSSDLCLSSPKFTQ